MYSKGEEISEDQIPDAFANFFKAKIEKILEESTVGEQVWKGNPKIHAGDQHFMTEKELTKIIGSISPKSCEEYNRHSNIWTVSFSAF